MESDKKSICILEGDTDMRELIRYTLSSFSWSCRAFSTASELFSAIKNSPPDIFILGSENSQESSLGVLRRLRSSEHTGNIPVIMIAAHSSEYERITALNAGADDYMTKPFGVLELAARVRSVLRRTEGQRGGPGMRKYLDVEIYPERYEAFRGGRRLELTVKEYELLRLLCENMGRVVTRDLLYSTVWGSGANESSRTLDMHIKTLRQKLGEGESAHKYIRVVRGVGYIFG